MPPFGPEDVAIVVPTIGRWDTLRECLAALARQTVSGFEVVVSVDGDGEVPAICDICDVRLVTGRRGGAGTARNRGVAATQRPLVLFLDDDMVATPWLVEAHLETHRRFCEPATAVLGDVVLHERVRGNAVNRWLERTGLQFEHHALRGAEGGDVGFGRFYSCNVSVRRDLFVAAGGFDERFLVYYEDTDLGWRLGQLGMRLRFAPRARSAHLQDLTWTGVVGRFRRIALGERLMATIHPWFVPHFLLRLRAAAARYGGPRLPDRLVERLLAVPGRLAGPIDVLGLAHLAPDYEVAFEAAGEICDLAIHLGKDFDPVLACLGPQRSGRAPSAPVRALHDLVRRSASREMTTALEDVTRRCSIGDTVLDVGGGSGLRLVERGLRVVYARLDATTEAFLRARYERRGASLPMWDGEVGGLAAALVTVGDASDLVSRIRRQRPRLPIVAVDASPTAMVPACDVVQRDTEVLGR